MLLNYFQKMFTLILNHNLIVIALRNNHIFIHYNINYWTLVSVSSVIHDYLEFVSFHSEYVDVAHILPDYEFVANGYHFGYSMEHFNV